MDLERRKFIRLCVATGISVAANLMLPGITHAALPSEDFPNTSKFHQELGLEKDIAPVHFNGDTRQPYVSLTIDDCWDIEKARKIKMIAEQAQIRLTFFPGGNLFRNSPYFWQEVLLAGHEIENHTADHPHLIKMSEAEILDQIDRSELYYKLTLGQYRPASEIPEMRYVRPPWGEGFMPIPNEEDRLRQEKRMKELMAKRKMGIVLWSNNITQIESIGPGSIVLLHANDDDLVALQRVIKIVNDRGLIPVTVNELLNPQIRRRNQRDFEKLT